MHPAGPQAGGGHVRAAVELHDHGRQGRPLGLSHRAHGSTGRHDQGGQRRGEPAVAAGPPAHGQAAERVSTGVVVKPAVVTNSVVMMRHGAWSALRTWKRDRAMCVAGEIVSILL
jgi:hypothetical protein